MKFNHVLLGIVCLIGAACNKDACPDHSYPPLKASRIEGAADSVRFNFSYYTSNCEDFSGFYEFDSAGIRVVYLKNATKGCNCVDTLHSAQHPYAFKTPGPGTYYYKWGPFDGAIDTIIIH